MYILKNSALMLLVGGLLTIICTLWIDKPLALWVKSHNIQDHDHWLIYLTYLDKILLGLVNILYFLFIILFCSGKKPKLTFNTLFLANSIFFSHTFKNYMKPIFGRYWPTSWKGNNLSLFHDNVYGFDWFHADGVNISFPSGHMVSVTAAMYVLWILAPKLRWLSILVCLLTLIGLTGMAYHFFGDCVAGIFTGLIVTYIISEVSQIKHLNE